MTTPATLWSFILVVGLLTLTPGLDTALILRTATIQSARSAWGVVLGIQTGTLIWGILASAGITALLTASHIAYEAVRWTGVAYLLWIGARMVRSTWRHPTEPPATLAPTTGGPAAPVAIDGPAATAEGPATGARTGFLPAWRRGLLTNLLNPKMGAFYVALLPQFIPAGATPLLYGTLFAAIHVVLGLAWSAVLVSTARRMRALLRRPRARRLLDRITGLVIVGFGVRLATESR
ncbi:lysine transporter LysE [Paractinoplanes abujensis]|uniref:Threonine/homoserine/homoserine lactone efflux protein n=1 Tax=Paractinoplanes abujensis TaxID=882441 RepID=A0A7W7CNJ7_9ACTN|nr:LysE family translocator [Actinoplanes abujensis]MBB4691845.1 threonine/homoserine/homoserine lactone efflux protein [Actinoplanes abujensis]GID16733.1 lysine transporter LysE [Actinoplanes abujensis]